MLKLVSVSIETLRGFVLLGILLMNIIGFAFPVAAYFKPVFDDAAHGINFLVYGFMELFAEGAMRTLFSRLFGAGLLLFVAKADACESKLKQLFCRRTLLLIGFGVIDAYFFLWLGDILFVYAAGLLLYSFRNLSPAKLAASGLFLLACLTLLHRIVHLEAKELRQNASAIEALPEGAAEAEAQLGVMAQWETFLSDQFVSPKQIAGELGQRK